jgi:hypothetical protein
MLTPPSPTFDLCDLKYAYTAEKISTPTDVEDTDASRM